MIYDLHTHSFLSDGALLPIELIRRAVARGCGALGITDHASASNLEWVLEMVARDCELARQEWGFAALAGVELTHVPVSAIGELVARARRAGAQLVVMHGETVVEPVPPGTNLAAVEAGVDILAHPGLLTAEVATLAARSGVFLEVSARQGHCLSNGLVVGLTRQAGALLLVNSDAHEPGDLLTADHARAVALGAGLSEQEADRALLHNPQALLERIGVPVGG